MTMSVTMVVVWSGIPGMAVFVAVFLVPLRVPFRTSAVAVQVVVLKPVAKILVRFVLMETGSAGRPRCTRGSRGGAAGSSKVISFKKGPARTQDDNDAHHQDSGFFHGDPIPGPTKLVNNICVKSAAPMIRQPAVIV
jgi:hypothetical protein